MKKIYIAFLSTLFIASVVAQTGIDRSHRPAAGPAPVISIADPVIYHLSNGITVLVVENHKLPKVSATYSIDAGPIKEGDKAGVMGIMGAMLEEGTKTMTKAQFDEAVDQMGSDLSLFSSGASVSALTRYFDKSFELMGQALRQPAFTQESFDKIKSQVLTGLKANEKNAKAISGNVVSALSYGLEHPDGEFETETTVKAITLDDVKKTYARYITPSRGFLTFVGDIKPEQAKALAEKTLGSWTGTALTLPVLKDVSNPSKTEVDLVDVPNAVQSEITVVNLIDLPMSSPDYFPLLLANQILGGGSEARLFMNLREKHGFTYGAYSSVSAGRYQTTFKAQASVRNDKVDSSVTEILSEIGRIRNEPISADELQSAKALYNGTFALRLEDPARTATFASNILINSLPKDFYRTYLQKINAVTIEDVQRVTNKYFNHDNTRVVVVGKAETVEPGLSKLGYPLNHYDRFAKPALAKQAVSINVSAADVIAKYVTSVGGAAELRKINTVSMTGEMSMQGMKLGVTEKKMSPNLDMTDMVMNGNAVVHEVFDGKGGYQSQMGQKKELSTSEITEKNDIKGIFPQLFYQDGSYKLEMAGTAKVGGKDAYKVKVTGPSGKDGFEYYDIATGYLVKDEKIIKQGDQEITQSVEYSNFKKLGNIFFPYTNNISVQTAAGSQEFTIEIKEIKVNQGVTAADFK